MTADKHITGPYVGRRNGLRVIKLFVSTADVICTGEVITNAYGNGTVNHDMSEYFSPDEWEVIVKQSRSLEAAA